MIVLDTTVLVYAVGDDHALRDPARAVLDAAYHRRIAATTTVEVIQEFLHVRARRRTRADAAEHAAAYMRLLSPLVSVDEATLAAALGVFTTNDRVGAFGSVLAAVVLGHPGSALVSADRAFAAVGGMTFHDLGAGTLLRDLGAKD
ncbi:MAG TPA: type II toxin-antitoxin system VapC family toxin [Acidimicrobiales bacterium]|nr:type II toxin-antitoxin system VapC family toxin [Acidimicrobiales bacterium]